MPRARRGERAHGSAPGGWRRLTVLGALSGAGMIAAMSIQAATTTRVFLAFLQAVPIPELRRRYPGATVLMDNLSAHKPKAVESALTKAGFTLLYLPRYSPDLSPIEPGWSKLKSVLRTAEARTRNRSKPPSPPPSTASPRLTHGAGSTIAVTRFQTDVKTALRRRCAPSSRSCIPPAARPTPSSDEYTAYAVEYRRRVKEQMNKRKPDSEFARIDLSYIGADGQEEVDIFR